MIAAALALLLAPVAHTQDPRNSNSDQLAGKFTDVTSSLGMQFEYQASHTSKKYLIETMGAGVALFDYDNDGRLDIFVVNGAPLNDPTPVGSIPQKTGQNIATGSSIKKRMELSRTPLKRQA